MSRRTYDPEQIPIRRNPGLEVHASSPVGPSDSSDSGSDLAGLGWTDDTSDRHGTGEGMTVDQDPEVRSDADLEFDRIVSSEEAGLGGGLDQAEEAQLEITDEEIEEHFPAT